jgi:hypothetical protein
MHPSAALHAAGPTMLLLMGLRLLGPRAPPSAAFIGEQAMKCNARWTIRRFSLS